MIFALSRLCGNEWQPPPCGPDVGSGMERCMEESSDRILENLDGFPPALLD